MARILFWNCYKRPIAITAAQLCQEHDADIAVFTETEAFRIADFLQNVNTGNGATFLHLWHTSKRFRVFSRLPQGSELALGDTGRALGFEMRPRIGPNFVIIAVHLPSKMHNDDADQSMDCDLLIDFIQECESKVGHQRTVVLGDFNMNPFEEGMVGAQGLHAVMDREIAQRGSRIVKGKERDYFYNPMWGRVGDNSQGPTGTYYHSSPGALAYYWHTFDQVLIRPGLVPYFPDQDLLIPSEARGIPLVNPNGFPDKSFSDHLPLLFTVETERMIHV